MYKGKVVTANSSDVFKNPDYLIGSLYDLRQILNVNEFNKVTAMKRYLCNGEVITASSREEAIKVFAGLLDKVNTKEGIYPTISRNDGKSFNKDVILDLKNRFKDNIVYDNHDYCIICCNIKTQKEVFEYLLNKGFNEKDLWKKSNSVAYKGVPLEDFKKFITSLGLKLVGSIKHGYDVEPDTNELSSRDLHLISQGYIISLAEIFGEYSHAYAIFNNYLTKRYEIGCIEVDGNLLILRKPFFDKTNMDWKKVILKRLIHSLTKEIKYFDSGDDYDSDYDKAYSKLSSLYKKLLVKLKSKLSKI